MTMNPVFASFYITWLPWVLSAVTILSTVLTGNKHRHAWLVGLAGQVGWFVFIWASETWGFLPLTVTLTILYWRNHLKWKRERDDVPAALHAAEALKPYLLKAEDAHEDLLEWRRRALEAEARLQTDEPVLFSAIHDGSSKTVKFRRYSPPPLTVGDYVAKVLRHENGIDFEPATAVPGIEMIEVPERP